MAKSNNIHILVVALGGWVNEEELKAIASYPYRKNKVNVEDFDELEFIRSDVRELICDSEYLATPSVQTCSCPCSHNGPSVTDVNECAERPCQNGGSALDGPGGCVCSCAYPWGGPRCADSE